MNDDTSSINPSPDARSLAHAMSPGRAARWFGLLGGGAAWTLHLLLAYLISEFACASGVRETVWLGVMVPAWMLLGMSASTLLLAVAATLVARHHDAQLRRRSDPNPADAYLARSGYILSGLFAFIILVQSVPIFFYLQHC